MLGSASGSSNTRRRSTLVPAVGRRGSHLEIYVLQEGSTVPSSEVLVELVDKVGFGWYQLAMIPLLLGVIMVEGSEMLVTSSLSAGVSQEFNMSATQQGGLSSSAFLGLALGTALSGVIADRYGRRSAILAGYLLMGIFGSLSALANSFATLMILRFMNGASCGLGVASAIAMLTEMSPLSYRSVSFVIIIVATTLGEIYAGFGLLIWMPDLKNGDWRLITLWAAAPAVVLFVLAFFFLDESAHWLAVAGRLEEARDVLIKMARMNGSTQSIESLAATTSASAQQSEAAKRVAATLAKEAQLSAGQIFQLFAKHRSLTWSLIFLALSFAVGNMLLFGMSYVVPQALRLINNGDGVEGLTPALEVIVIRSCGFVSAAVAIGAMASPIGHRSVIASSSFVCAGALLWSAFAMESGGGSLVAASAIVLIASNTYYIALMNLCSESFPTVVRALGVGFAITVGRSGAIATPLVAEWVGLQKFLQIAAYVCFFAACLMLPLKETKGLPLNDFPEESLASSQQNYGSADKSRALDDEEGGSASAVSDEDTDALPEQHP